MNCIIIEDDKYSRKLIEEFVGKTEILNLLHSFSNAVDAINYINTDEIHLIFLDVEMPEMTGIEFLKNIRKYPQVIIISAKDKYALEAFEYDVTDYILKPITYSRFYKAVNKAVDRHYARNGNPESATEIFVKKNSSLVRVKFEDILWIEALENYVIVSTFQEKYTIHFTMKAIEQKLPVSIFRRVHRSYIVNINQIMLIEDNQIIMSIADEIKQIPIGKSYKDKLMLDLNFI